MNRNAGSIHRMALWLAIVIGVGAAAIASGHTIYEVQYNETQQGSGDDCYPSPFENQTVTITGVVTAITEALDFDNFFIQDSSGWYNGDSSGVWCGIYVFDNYVHPSRGDYITMTGTITEYYGMTEIDPSVYEILGTRPEPDTVWVTCADIPPNCDSNGERYEGMLVGIQNVVVVDEKNEYGEWYVSDDGGVHKTQIDDHCYVYPDDSVYVGKEFEHIIGPAMYAFYEYEVDPRSMEDIRESGIAEEPSPSAQVTPLSLDGNYPNPFTTSTVIKYSVPGHAGNGERVVVRVYDAAGRLVRTLLDGSKEPGVHVIHWDGRDDASTQVPPGIYFCRLEQEGSSRTIKMVLMR